MAERETYPYRLATNDPAHPLITFTLVADIKPLPQIYSRFQNADYLSGQRVATFEVWPTRRPFIVMEKGEHLTVPLRVWRGQIDSSIATTTTEDGAHNKPAEGNERARPSEAELPPFPPGSVTHRIRPGSDRRGFWVDIEIAGVDKGGRFAWSTTVADPVTGQSLPIELSALVYEENLIVNPRSLDGGQVSLAELKATPIIAATLNVRKMIGPIHIRGVSSTLGFAKGGVQVLVDGSNYLVKVYLIANPGVDPGKYQGALTIATDDPAHRQIDVPFKVAFVP